MPVFPDLDDESQPVADRARAWLDVNCAHCHRPEGPGNATIDLRYRTPLDAMRVVDAEPAWGNMTSRGGRIVVPGDPDRSVLYLRLQERPIGRMPPLATERVDPQGLDIVRRWIESL
jgi:mono/diheme cytochrome c family protein